MGDTVPPSGSRGQGGTSGPVQPPTETETDMTTIDTIVDELDNVVDNLMAQALALVDNVACRIPTIETVAVDIDWLAAAIEGVLLYHTETVHTFSVYREDRYWGNFRISVKRPIEPGKDVRVFVGVSCLDAPTIYASACLASA